MRRTNPSCSRFVQEEVSFWDVSITTYRGAAISIPSRVASAATGKVNCFGDIRHVTEAHTGREQSEDFHSKFHSLSAGHRLQRGNLDRIMTVFGPRGHTRLPPKG